jgi:type I restriction enzyme, S subunit
VTKADDLGPQPYIALESVESGTGRLFSPESLPEREDADAGVASAACGDVLFSKLRPYLRKTWLVDRPCYASTELLCIRPGMRLDSRWLSYLASSQHFVDWAVATSDGTKMPRTSWEKMAELRFDVPTPNEQRGIADYLDRETARIDALIEKKQRMVELLDHAFAARVEDALCTSTSEVIPMRRLLNTPPQYGAGETGEEGEASWPRYIRISDLNADGTLRDDDVRRLPPLVARPYMLDDGDVLFARSGATVGKAFIYRAAMGPCCFAGYLIRFGLMRRDSWED